MPDLRRQRRVVYHTNIRLRSPGREHSVVARVQNLSRSGAFVTAPELPSAGTEVVCRLAVAGERCTLKGRIAWVRPATEENGDGGPSSGAGISFEGITEKDEEILGRLVEPPQSDRQAVDVWFEGMSKPIRSHASIGVDGLGLSTRLPFLRLHSPVRVSFVRNGVEEVRSGVLDAVTLEPSGADGVPQLQLTVSTPLADAVAGIIHTPEPLRGGTPAEGVLLGEPRTVVDEAAAEVTPPPTRAEVVVEPAPSPPVAAPQTSDRTLRYYHEAEPNTISPVPAPTPVVPPPPKSSSGQAVMVTLGLVALGAAAAVGYYLGGGTSATATLKSTLENTAVSAPPAPSPAPPVVIPPPAAGTPVPAAAMPTAAALPAAPAPAPAEAAPEEDARPKAKEKEIEGFTVTGDRDDGTLVVALAGTPKGMRQFRLVDPPGLLLRFPKAKLKASLGVHSPGGAFKRVVVGRKGLSGHVRIYLTPEQTTDLSSDASSVRVDVHTKRKR
jgi:hypothetical protein